jgi:hypothetical protein
MRPGATDGRRSATDGRGAATDGRRSATDGRGAATDGRPAATDGRGAATDGRPAAADGRGAAIGCHFAKRLARRWIHHLPSSCIGSGAPCGVERSRRACSRSSNALFARLGSLRSTRSGSETSADLFGARRRRLHDSRRWFAGDVGCSLDGCGSLLGSCRGRSCWRSTRGRRPFRSRGARFRESLGASTVARGLVTTVGARIDRCFRR